MRNIIVFIHNPIDVLSDISSCETLPALESTVSYEFWHQHKFSASINSIKCLQCIQNLPEIVPLGDEALKNQTPDISSKQPIAKQLEVKRQCVTSHNKHDHTNFFENENCKVICKTL
jgi:hypothetical protein